jgi:hypothetical protein
MQLCSFNWLKKCASVWHSISFQQSLIVARFRSILWPEDVRIDNDSIVIKRPFNTKSLIAKEMLLVQL